MSSHTYTSIYPPNITISPSLKKFFQDFYRITDIPTAHDEYIDFFTENADFVVGSRKASGRAEISNLRKSMWTTVSSRLHNPQKIFPFGNDSNEVMIMGTVEYGFRDGGGAVVGWAANAKVVEGGDGGLKMESYRVFLDSAAVKPDSK